MQLAGGLGNQLFQVAAGKFYSLHWGRPLKIDALQLIKHFSPHRSSVWSFLMIDRKVISYLSILQAWFFGLELARHLRLKPALVHRAASIADRRLGIYKSPQGGYDSFLESISTPPRVISGFFQSWRYADFLFHNDPSFRGGLSLKRPSTWFEQLSREVLETRPVSVHIRRGDYKTAQEVFGLLGKTYYHLAIQRMNDLNPNRHFWVFSDEPDAAAQIVSPDVSDKVKFITPPSNSDPAETMVLMSMCSGHIVANSSFSWWGAFMGSGGPVIAPEKWFLGSPDPVDLIPPHWHKIPSYFEE